MSKYIQDLEKQLQGKNICEITKQMKADNNISKILKERMEKEKRSKINKEIQAMLQGR